MKPSSVERFALLFYLVALLLGVGCGLLHLWMESSEQPDPILSALAVAAATMLLGVLRPARPWRWVILVGAPVPLALVIARLAMGEHFTRASIAGSILIILPGVAGAYGGSILRRKTAELFFEDKPDPGVNV